MCQCKKKLLLSYLAKRHDRFSKAAYELDFINKDFLALPSCQSCFLKSSQRASVIQVRDVSFDEIKS